MTSFLHCLPAPPQQLQQRPPHRPTPHNRASGVSGSPHSRAITMLLCVCACISLITSCGQTKTETSTNTETSSELSQFMDNELEMFLIPGATQGSYQFVACDSKNTDSALGDHFDPHALPANCTPAYQSAPIVQLCKNYEAEKHVCSRREEIAAFCANPETAAPPPGLSIAACPGLTHLPYTCPHLMSTLARPCETLISKIRICQDSSGEDSQECDQARAYAKFRTPFYLHNLQFSPQRKLNIWEHLKYEDFLATKHTQSPSARRWQYFGSGASWSLLNAHTYKQFMKIMPDNKIMNHQFSLFGKKLGAKRVAAFFPYATAVTAFSGQSFNAISYLQTYHGYLPAGECGVKTIVDTLLPDTLSSTLSQAINTKPPKPVENFKKMELEFKQAIIPFFTGIGTNIALAKITSNSHPVLAIGTVAIAPLLGVLFGHGPTDRTPQDLIKNFHKALQPSAQQSGPIRVHKMEELIPLLGRSLAITEPTFALKEYCLPKRQDDGSYSTHCESILQGRTDWVAEMVEKTPDNTHSCEHILRQQLEITYPLGGAEIEDMISSFSQPL